MISEQEAKQIGRQLFESYSDNGKVDAFKLIKDGQRLLGYDYTPTEDEVNSYSSHILDYNKDKNITFQDFEALAIKYLCGGVIHHSTQQHKEVEEPVKRYSKSVEQRLDVARRLFKKFDRDQSGTIMREEVGQIIEDTYKELGMNNQKITSQDIDDWMKFNDVNGDGKVTLSEYEQVILQSLKKAGISLD